MHSYTKTLFSITEVAKEIGVEPSTLRYWQTQFPNQIKPRTNAHGTRQYTHRDIAYIKQIRDMLKEQGMTIKGAQRKLSKGNSRFGDENPVDLLLDIKGELEKIRTALNGLSEE